MGITTRFTRALGAMRISRRCFFPPGQLGPHYIGHFLMPPIAVKLAKPIAASLQAAGIRAGMMPLMGFGADAA